MSVVDVLQEEISRAYDVTEHLFRQAEGEPLGWKPTTGSNWMTLGQLLEHCSTACGSTVKGFVTGDWGLPEGVTMQDLPAEDVLPPAEKLPTTESVEAALERLRTDRVTALELLAGVDDETLLTSRSAAPWGGPEVTLLQHLLLSLQHLNQHKGQLFYYLKLRGQAVDTADLWGG